MHDLSRAQIAWKQEYIGSSVDLLDDTWVDIFHPKDGNLQDIPRYDRMHEHCLYQKFLLKPAQDALDILPKPNYEPTLIIGLDEVSPLTAATQSTLFITALYRTVRGLRHLRLWVFLLSTKRPVKDIAPMISEDPSTRRRNKGLAKAPPSCLFFLDLPMYCRMEDTNSAMKEKRKPLHIFSSLDHMAARGRVLWSSFTHADTQPLGPSDEIRGFVREKLLRSTAFDAKNNDHVFSVVKNKINKTALDLTKLNQKDFYESHFVLDGAHMPVITVTMDLSCPPLKDGKRVQIATSYNANVFRFHVNGHTHDTHQCVAEVMSGFITKILNSENNEETGQASCTQMNRLYDRHTWKTRYPPMTGRPSTVEPTAQLTI
ncbi:hypothetical protein EX30DRAFT_350825 [Ascodesmis nigricans]|uniref:Uncharacterized protein n=1 Tax=Ascodesmis nigricans TaxID=341454 RepID=A0A4S2MNX3_9PEZI|nr:hypothetical protein EX30DRAFT_350825 [Ascodesmis nigricans]